MVIAVVMVEVVVVVEQLNSEARLSVMSVMMVAVLGLLIVQ
jgi:hypothetical protein